MIFCAAWTGAASAQSTSRAYACKPIRGLTSGGMMSAETVPRDTPGGYTLLLATGAHTTGAHTIRPNYFKLSYDMQRDFTAVSLLGTIS